MNILIRSSQTAQVAQKFDADSTLGAIQVGVMISLFLFGLVTAQVYIYMNRFHNDPWILKYLVPTVWILELAHTICVCHALYVITVTQYGRPQLLVVPPLSLDAAILFSGFIGPIEQGWFAYRVYRFSQRLFIPICCTILAFTRWLGSMALSIVAFHRLTIEDYMAHWSWLLTSILVVGACADVILAGSLCFYLNQWKGAGFQRTSKLIKRLMLWTIVFSNSFLASLNARPVLAQLYDQDAQIDVSMDAPPTNRRRTLELSDVHLMRSAMRTLPSAVGKEKYPESFIEVRNVVWAAVTPTIHEKKDPTR
ncbi:hypothetical protein CVT24_000241 [Panaeolus cyanescens]|uniref:Integral membrane protein n=1 Tax=Panaeolus cyanescens TaxID=181874 RepID=A0A409VIF2_9AGAR|nr:hypothetical protein CVT24_000241 [Panaeolus cyanescens]